MIGFSAPATLLEVLLRSPHQSAAVPLYTDRLAAIAHQRPSSSQRALRHVDGDRRLFSEDDPRVIDLLTLPVVNAPLRDVRAASLPLE